jgi:hypothetical protein
MLFLTYWELSETMPAWERLNAFGKISAMGLIPFDGLTIIRWDMTPDGWGVLVAEAESAAVIDKAVSMWRVAGTGFFNFTRTAPAQPVQEAIAQRAELLKLMGAT